MAEAVGDRESATTYRRIFESGRSKHEELWNGEYYVQRVPSVQEVQPLLSASDEPWHANGVVDGQLRYQYGAGCLTRLSTAALLNVTAGGGSTVPSFILERRD